MSLDVLAQRGVPLDRQRFTWRELAGAPISKLDDDAFTRLRVILMSGIESEAIRFGHQCARMNRALRLPLAEIRRVEHHQQTMVSWLNPPDQSPLETTIGFEQAAIEVTASIAQHEPDPYLAQMFRFGMLEDVDHLYRYAALLDRVDGRDANNLLQSYTDIRPGRPAIVEHRAPEDDLRRPYDHRTTSPVSKLNVLTITAGELRTHDYYMSIGPTFADPVARALYAEIASIEEQHVTQYESLADPDESWLEQWLLHEVTEAYNYWSCLQYESNPRVKAIWERFLDYELGHLDVVKELFRSIERRDPAEVLPREFPDAIAYRSQRDFVWRTLVSEVDLRARGTELVPKSAETADAPSVRYRDGLNAGGSPSEAVATGYRWRPGGELARGDGVGGTEEEVRA